jgi:hypothetical protein
VEDRLVVSAGAEHAVGRQHMEVDVAVEGATEAMNKRNGVEAGICRSSGTALAEACRREDRAPGNLNGPR